MSFSFLPLGEGQDEGLTKDHIRDFVLPHNQRQGNLSLSAGSEGHSQPFTILAGCISHNSSQLSVADRNMKTLWSSRQALIPNPSPRVRREQRRNEDEASF